MKRFNLISILILFFTFFGVQCIVADETREANQPNSSSPYYTTLNNTNEYDIYSNNLKINLYYPSNKVTWLTTTNKFLGTYYNGSVTLKENGSENSTTPVTGKDIFIEKSIESSTSYIDFNYNYEVGDWASQIKIKDIKIYIAPHIRLLNKTQNNVTYTTIDENTVNTANATLDFGKRNVNSQTRFQIFSCTKRS